MGFWSKLFGKKEEEQVNLPEQANSIENEEKRFCDKTCELCGQVIGEDRYKRVSGRFFHKSCFKKQSKAVFNGQVS